MKNKNILLALFLLLLACLSIQTISAENIADNLNEIEALDSYSDDLSVNTHSNDLNIDSYKKSELLSNSNQETIPDEERNILINTNQETILKQNTNQETISAQGSDPLPNVENGTVSGGIDFVNIHPWAPSDAINGNKGNITYNIPSNANIKSAYIYVNIYSGSGGTAYGAYANTTITTANGEQLLGNEYLWTSTSSQDGVNYIVNDHITRCYSDYMIFYNVTEMLQGLNGSSVSVDVISYPIPDKSFDGRIKLISLFVAWDDGDEDEIYYWLNAGQAWSDDTENGLSHSFENLPELNYLEKLSTLINVGASSTDAMYYLDGSILFSESEDDEYLSGAYYQYHKWDISHYIIPDSLELTYKPVGGAYGPSFKELISILTIQDIPTYEEDVAEISITPEFTEIPCAYAGTNNTLTIKITTKAGNYTVRLLADGHVVKQTEMNLNNGTNLLLLTDSTIRPVDEFTVNGEENEKVNYTVEVLSRGNLINSSSIILPILYNGYLGKDLAYPSGGIESFLNITINGDIVIDIQNYSQYISHNILNRSEVWNVDLDANSNIVKSFIYIPYYEFNSKTYDEDIYMFNVTFNNVNISPIELYKDHSNLGIDYYSGYGVLLYDVTNLIRNGENVLELNKKFDTPAVYPSALIYMYNTTLSNYIKEIFIYNGADLLENINNLANRTVHSDSEINVNSQLVSNASLYVFAGGPQNNEGDLIFNDEVYENIWNGTMASNEAYSLDITNSLRDNNSISFLATGSRIIALQQIMVLTKNLDMLDIILESEYPDTCYAGTNNSIFANIAANSEKRLTARLLADGEILNESEIDLIYGFNEFIFVDSTIRTADEFSVNGAQNNIVNYTLQLLSDDGIIANKSIYLNILYNGYLSKDLAYPKGAIESFLNITINGDIVIDVKNASSYMSDFDIERTDIWKIDLDNKSRIVKAFVYVPYEWCNINLITENEDIFNVKFNNNEISPIAWYRDQSNLGQYGKYGYGLFVYDVTNLVLNGNNSFILNKIEPTPRVYPSTLVYIYNTTGSSVIKNIYISNGADLLSKDPNRLVQMKSTIDVDSIADVAKLYIFAANAQDGEGDIIFNDEIYENVWNGSTTTTSLYTLNISNTIKNNNNLSFVVRNGSILALQQMIITTQKAQSQIIASDLTTVYNSNDTLVIGLNEPNGIPISNANLTVVFNGNTNILTTNNEGQISLDIPPTLSPNTYDVDISYEGDDSHNESTAKVKVTIEKIATKIIASDLRTVYKDSGTLVIGLNESNGIPISNANLTVVFNGNTNILTTDENGEISLDIPPTLSPNTYDVDISYEGDDIHKESSLKVKVIVEKSPTVITAPSLTTVYNTNKKLLVTLKDSKGNAIANAKMTVVLNGASKVLTTNANGQASLAIPSNLVPKTYTATISYPGDGNYIKSSFSTKVLVKKASVKLAAAKKTFKAKVKTKKYTVTLKNNKNKVMKKVKLTLKLKGKTYKASTNTKGKATFKIKNLSKKGRYTAKVIYKGNKYFNRLTKKVKIKIK
ncbi:DUF3344 domain-containing protein [Methanobrevibacter olleyae]|uniref:Adhesin-like protein n=1 Tax=Methanobrevibacter olleyae TaxID=294671 RepID=A0A126R3U5_METOL|nr:DUF3344 domain-containing protein [Methanobrevibacter olleyae]AMK16345.1 adhesin-like protein [Methanobrevibacter olleyae]